MCGCTCKRWCWNCILHYRCAQTHLTAGVCTHSHVESQQGKAPTVSSRYLRCQDVSCPADHRCCDGGSGIKYQVLLEKKAKHFLTYVMHSFEVCESSVFLRWCHYQAAPLTLWTIWGLKLILMTETSANCAVTCHPAVWNGATHHHLFPLFKSEENICVEVFHLTLAASLEPGELLD